MDRVKVFVYGTLKRNFGAHYKLGNNAKFLGEETIPGILIPMNGFPALIPSVDCAVHGEVFEIDDNLIPDLDRYEGVHANFYKRRVIKTEDYGDVFYYEYCTKISLTDKTLVVSRGKWTHDSSRLVSSLCHYKELQEYWLNMRGELAEATVALTPPNPLMVPQERATETPPWEGTRQMLDRVYGKSVADRTLPTVCPIPEPESVPLAVPATVGKF